MTDREGGKKMNRLDLIIDALEKANDGGNVLTSMRKHSPQPVNCGSWSLLLGNMKNTDQRLWVTYNGLIRFNLYNHQTIQNALKT